MNDLLENSQPDDYNASSIEVLEGLEPVRKRPGMYIGGTDERALHHMVAEVLDNSMDEAVAGHANRIEVELHEDYSLTVRDNGRGIPIDPHPKFPDKSALEVILCTLHAGGKFSGKAYQTSGGLHGVGASVVNALSDLMVVQVARNKELFEQRFSRGIPQGPVEKIGAAPNRRGTTVTFHADAEIFGSHRFKPARLFKSIRSKAYLFSGVEIRWKSAIDDGETPTEATFHFPGGLSDYLNETLGTATTPAHLQVLSRSADTIVFCFDGDKAGKDAAWKALKTSLPSITSGLIIKFLILPEEEDPDTLIKKESAKAFSKRIETAQTLSSFLIDHIKAEVPFDTIEGKTLFLEKSASLINMVNYPIYRQQLIEGIANTVGQNIIQVEKAVEQNKTQNAQFSKNIHSGINQNSLKPMTQKPSINSNLSMKSLMSRMISCVLTYPSIVNDPETSSVIEERARKLPQSDVLLELIRHAQVESDLSKEALILPYKAKERVYLRLQQLSTMEPFLSEFEAKEEFSYALTAAEKYYERKSTKASILSAKTHDEEKAVMKNIMKSKMKTEGQKKTP